MSDRLIRVTADPISADEAHAFVADPGAGGTCVFAGTVRDSSDAGEVTGITYEAWEELALARLNELADQIFGKWPVRRLAILHRTGELAVGETSVIVTVTYPVSLSRPSWAGRLAGRRAPFLPGICRSDSVRPTKWPAEVLTRLVS